MHLLDCSDIIARAWKAYGGEKKIKTIADVSAKVSTNYVFKILFTDSTFILTKLSFFGKYEIFCEDHTIINVLANNLPHPYQNFLARSLTKNNELFTYRLTEGIVDVWVVFYHAVDIKEKMPRRLDELHIKALGRELALFHKACSGVRKILPPSSINVIKDIEQLLDILCTAEGMSEHGRHHDVISEQCHIFLNNLEKLNYRSFETIPVFVDWNIGNFSVTADCKFYSRWDYDWFRISSRVLDFYFFSRVTSDIGDRTTFSYLPDTLMEERFLLFLKEYHNYYPLTEKEILFFKEAYRFFILNYVIKHGNYFFTPIFAKRLQREAYKLYFNQIEEKLDTGKILKALKI
ncbi:MAG: hypothetical protein JXB34_08785 [Bacteroidales bacterium]|nr:hypothetical protein [Bacteroidales bacterium]